MADVFYRVWMHGHNAKIRETKRFKLDIQPGYVLVTAPEPFTPAYYSEWVVWKPIRCWVHFEIPSASFLDFRKRDKPPDIIVPQKLELMQVHVRFNNPWSSNELGQEYPMGEIYGLQIWDAEEMKYYKQFKSSTPAQMPPGKYPNRYGEGPEWELGLSTKKWTTATWPNDYGAGVETWRDIVIEHGIGVSLDIGLTQAWHKPGAIMLSSVACDFKAEK